MVNSCDASIESTPIKHFNTLSSMRRNDYFDSDKDLLLLARVENYNRIIIVEANDLIYDYIPSYFPQKSTLDQFLFAENIQAILEELKRKRSRTISITCYGISNIHLHIQARIYDIKSNGLPEGRLILFKVVPVDISLTSTSSKEDEFKSISKFESKVQDLLIPPLEIKCKCTEAVCLFMCKLCFNKDSQLCLGVGSYALAFYALWAGTPVAVKAFQKTKKGVNSKKREKKVLESFRRELEVLKSLRHPNVIGLYGYQEEGLYLVMEVARNGCLADKIRINKQREFSNIVWPIHLKIALELVSGLNFLHGRGFIHGDLKSFNVLLDSNYTVKIADFGTSGTEQNKPKNSPLSIAWASPKRLKGEVISMSSDIYAVGIILWELATLKLPFDTFSGSPQKLASRILHLNLRPEIEGYLESLLSGYRVPTLYVWLMQKIWQKEECDRPRLTEIYSALLSVKASWKCANCGWHNLKQSSICQGCEFDPFSASEINKSMEKSVQITHTDPSTNSNLEEILFTPKISKRKTKPIQEQQERSVPLNRRIEQFRKDSKQNLMNTQELVADLDFSKIVNTDSGISQIMKDQMDEEKYGAFDTIASDFDSRSVTFKDEVGDDLTSDRPVASNKLGIYQKLVGENIGKGIIKRGEVPSKVYEKSYKRPRDIKPKGTEEVSVEPIFVSKPSKDQCCREEGCRYENIDNQPKERRIYASLDKHDVSDIDQSMLDNLEVAKMNTLDNQNMNDTVTLSKEQSMKQSYDYSKYPRSCIVKDCGKCTFKTNCVLNVHKNLHNMDTRSGKSFLSDSVENFELDFENEKSNDRAPIYRSQKLGSDSLNTAYSYQAEEEEEWFCDLCNAQNKEQDKECCSCMAIRL